MSNTENLILVYFWIWDIYEIMEIVDGKWWPRKTGLKFPEDWAHFSQLKEVVK
jgi:hypothetical protein